MIDILLNLNVHLSDLVASAGPWIYVILFAIIFAETGLVIMPFLPGDSLLFAVGALTALPASGLSLTVILVLLTIAAIVGDAVNYTIGALFGARVLNKPSRLIKRSHIEQTQKFYDQHGGKTIILARFMPIVRTFAPFVAGLAQMNYRQFAIYNMVGGGVWIASLTLAGYWFGNLPAIQRNFHIVIVAIIAISLAPVAIEYWRNRPAPPQA